MRWQFTLTKIEYVLGVPVPTVLPISEPIGWKEIEFTLKRDKAWHGVFFEYSLPLKYYNDPQISARAAYDLVKGMYESYGAAAEVYLTVESACNDTDAFTEEGVWRLNFTSYKEEIGVLCLAETNLEPENILMTFRSRYDQKVDLDSLESFGGEVLSAYTNLGSNLSILPKAVIIKSVLKWAQPVLGPNAAEYQETDTITAGGGTDTRDVEVWFGVGFNVFTLDEVETRLYDGANSATSLATVQALYECLYTGTYTIEIDNGVSDVVGAVMSATVDAITDADNSDCNITDAFDQEMTVELFLDAGGTIVSLFTDTEINFCDSVGGKNMNISPAVYSGIFSLTAGDTIKLYARVYAQGKWDQQLLSENDVYWTVSFFEVQVGLTITLLALTEPTDCRVYAINETGSRILESITDDNFRLLSTYFGRTDSEPYASPDAADGCGSLEVVTMGLLLRQAANVIFSMSFKQWFENLNAIHNIGIGLEPDTDRGGSYQVVRAEPMEYFYDPAIILQLDKIPAAVRIILQEEHYGTFKFGFDKWEAEEYTGLDEFATDREYRTTISSITNTLTQICMWIASGYAIEITRWQQIFDADTQADWRFDNDTFIICVKRNASDPALLEVEQGNITGDANMIDPTTIYNFRISPVRNALRWLRTVLNSYRDPEDGNSKLIFTDGTGNVLATGLMTGDCIIENAALAENQTLDYTNTGDPWDAHPIYMPELWEFDYPLSFSEYQTLKATPTKTIQGRFAQETAWRDFYLRTVAYKPNDGMATWQLLPKRAYTLDKCIIYIIQTRGDGSATFGSILLTGASLENLFVFVNGNLMKYNDVNPANNEILSFDTTTGYGLLNFDVTVGRQITVIHLPPMVEDCDACIHRFEGNGSGDKVPVLTGFGVVSLASMFVFYNGELMKYNDAVAANNELTSYVGGTEVLTFKANTNVNRELRVFGFANCECIRVFSGNGDGTDSPTVTGLGDGTLANIFVFYNGNLLKYNDSNTLNNEILSYDSGVPEIVLNNTTNVNRELRAFKLENC